MYYIRKTSFICICLLFASVLTDKLTISSKHSLFSPAYSSMSNGFWIYGGSTVITTKHVRLTSENPNQKGWIQNTFPLLSTSGEIIFDIQSHQTKRTTQGDGMAFWFLSNRDSIYNFNSIFSQGNIFGGPNSFEGFAIILDLYDNKLRRPYPKIYLIERNNNKTPITGFNNDFSNEMTRNGQPHYCSPNFFLSGTRMNILVKLFPEKISVYYRKSQSNERAGYIHCLTVTLAKKVTEPPFMAISASTSTEFNTNFEVHSISSRFKLDAYNESDRHQEPSDFKRQREKYSMDILTSKGQRIFWFAIFALDLCLLLECVWELNQLSLLKSELMNPEIICKMINEVVLLVYCVQIGIFVIFVVMKRLFVVLLFAPITVWRVMRIRKKSWRLKGADFSAVQGKGGWIYLKTLYFCLVVYVVFGVYSIGNLVSY